MLLIFGLIIGVVLILFILFGMFYLPDMLLRRAAKSKNVDPTEAIYTANRSDLRYFYVDPALKMKWKNELYFLRGIRLIFAGLIISPFLIIISISVKMIVPSLDGLAVISTFPFFIGLYMVFKRWPLLFSSNNAQMSL